MTTRLQKDRNRQYFVDATKNVVIAEGVSNVTVRKIADIAGFSYATIYNYFHDFDHLLWHVVMSCIDDVVHFLENHLGSKPYTFNKIKEIYREYVSYFLQRPNVFRLIFFHQIGDPPEEFRSNNSEPILAPLLLTNLEDPGCRRVDKNEVPVLAKIITSSVHGMLSLYLSKKTDQSPDDLKLNVDKMLAYLLLKRP